MTTRIAKWGHSLAVRIPKVFAEQAGLEEGAEVGISVSNGKLILSLEEPEYDLNALVEGITPENRHQETDWGAPTGREIW
ncbi:MAG: AbrB/MazE/SpoVT family DNA-binding domain-containing protein [Proteobacteria bacterium]|nr:AbrB/MazE/SpoVT family DNA-binding domain-containing protein [Pseudomonadota bacterium]